MQTLSAITGVQQGPRPLTRCEGGPPEQIPVSPCGFTADGFLSHRFLPLYEPAAELPEIKDWKRECLTPFPYLKSNMISK
jgi:hypothetical protein